MSEKSIKFGDKKVDQKSFYKNKKTFKMEDININKILASKKAPYGKELTKYYIGYNNDDGIRPLCIKLPQMVGYVKHFQKNSSKDTITLSFNATNKKKYTEIWEKVSSLISREFDSYPVYGDKYIGAKIRQYEDKININV